MSSQLGNKIFGSSDSISETEMQRYLEGKLSSEEARAIEQKISNDPLSADAVEGFESNPQALAGLASLKQDFHAKHGAGSAGFWASNKSWLLGAGIAAAGTAILFLWLQPQPKVPATVATQGPTKNTTTFAAPVSPVEVEPITEQQIDASEPLPEAQQITYAVALENQPETTDEPEILTPNKPAEDEPTHEETTPAIAQQEKTIETPIETLPGNTKVVEPQKKVVRSNVAITYLHDLKVVDYSSLFKSPIELPTLVQKATENHLDAPFETYQQQALARAEPGEIEVVVIPYMAFLEQAMGKFNQNDFKGALKNFQKILKQYPTDANAQFYSGLCLHNIDRWRDAIKSFDLAISNQANTFNQEAYWYKALVYLEKGRFKKAKPILEKISEEKGFYAERANEALIEVNQELED